VEGASSHSNERPIPLAKQWGVTAATRIWIGGHDLDARREVSIRLVGAARPATGPIDLAFITPLTVDEALYFAEKLRPRLTPGGAVWIVHGETDDSEQDATHLTAAQLAVAAAARGWTAAREVPISERSSSTRFEPEQ
jgi:hypothetical protein